MLFLFSLFLFFVCSSNPVEIDTTPIDTEIKYEITNVGFFSPHMERQATWSFPPDIRICPFSPVTKEQVIKAVSWWTERGYNIGIVTQGGVWGGCDGQRAFGFITISLNGQGFTMDGHLGETRFYRRDEIIIFSEIQLTEEAAQKERVLEHEIGHALGWLHINKRDHMMHPVWAQGGYLDDFIDLRDESSPAATD